MKTKRKPFKVIKRVDVTVETLTIRQRIANAVSIITAIPVTIITVGMFVFAVAAVAGVAQLLPSTPTIVPLQERAYAPAQVVFKVRAGKNAKTVASKNITKKQTLYKNKKSGDVVGSYDAAYKKSPKDYQKVTIQPTLKNVTQVFPKTKISGEVRKKILQRTGAIDPDVAYNELGMGRWYIAEVSQQDVDVPTLIQQLSGDAKNVEVAEANSFSESLTATPQEVADEDPSGGSTNAVSNLGTTGTSSVAPNDPKFSSSGTIGTGVRDQWGLVATRIDSAWQNTTGSSDVLIGLIEAGVNFYHADLRENIWINAEEDINHNECADYWGAEDNTRTDVTSEMKTDCRGNLVYGDLDGIDNDNNGYTDDVNGMDVQYGLTNSNVNDKMGPIGSITGQGHGTAVASIMAAATNNDKIMAGVCWSCKIIPVDVGDYRTDTAMAAGIQYVVAQGARIVNISSGGKTGYTAELYSAIEYANLVGTIVVASAGNGNVSTDDNYPSAFSEVISVGGSSIDDNRWYGGSTEGSNYGETLDLVAPAALSLVLSTDYDQQPALQTYAWSRGTSVATPYVSGIIGLMLSVNPSLSSDGVQRILEDTATDITTATDENGEVQTGLDGWDQYTGYGLVNAEAAVQRALDVRPNLRFDPLSPELSLTPITDSTYRFITRVENQTSAVGQYYDADVTNMKYRIYDAAQTKLIYEGTVDQIDANSSTTVFQDFKYNLEMPDQVYVKIDPFNAIFESNESDNKSAKFAVAAGGTPYQTGATQAIQKAASNRTFKLVYETATSTGDAVDYQAATPYPAGSKIDGNTLTWVPTDAQVGKTYTLSTRASNHNNPTLSTVITNSVTVIAGPSGPYLTITSDGTFPHDITDGELAVANMGDYIDGFFNECYWYDRTDPDSPVGLPTAFGTGDNDRFRCRRWEAFNLVPYGIPVDDLAYVRLRVWNASKWTVAPNNRTAIDDNSDITLLADKSFLFDVRPTVQTETYHQCTDRGNTDLCVDYDNYSSAATLRFVEQNDNGEDMPSTGWYWGNTGWPRSWGDWALEAWTKAEGAQQKNGIGLRVWTNGPALNNILRNISMAVIDDSDGKIRPKFSLELHLKSLNEAPVITVDQSAITVPTRNVPIKFTVTATDINGDYVTIGRTLPTGASMKYLSQTPGESKVEITWTPNYSVAGGTYNFLFSANDGLTTSKSTIVPVKVNNKPPTLSAIGTVHTPAGKTTTKIIHYTDVDGDPVKLTTDCSWTEVSTGTMIVNPPAYACGMRTCKVSANDGATAVSQTVTMDRDQECSSSGGDNLIEKDQGTAIPRKEN